jgi:tRNA (guanine10-N2)-methyltransferase
MNVDAVNNRIIDKRSREVINMFAWTGLRGKIDLKKPDVEFTILEDCEWSYPNVGLTPDDLVQTHTKDARMQRDGNWEAVYMGRLVGVSRARPIINTHEIRKRVFYGNTSMDPEMGLLTAGQALAAPGRIVYDPFVGTGSLLYSAAHWGATVMGSDIDARQFKGKRECEHHSSLTSREGQGRHSRHLPLGRAVRPPRPLPRLHQL